MTRSKSSLWATLACFKHSPLWAREYLITSGLCKIAAPNKYGSICNSFVANCNAKPFWLRAANTIFRCALNIGLTNSKSKPLHFIIAITLFSSSGITFLISIISPPSSPSPSLWTLQSISRLVLSFKSMTSFSLTKVWVFDGGDDDDNDDNDNGDNDDDDGGGGLGGALDRIVITSRSILKEGDINSFALVFCFNASRTICLFAFNDWDAYLSAKPFSVTAIMTRSKSSLWATLACFKHSPLWAREYLITSGLCKIAAPNKYGSICNSFVANCNAKPFWLRAANTIFRCALNIGLTNSKSKPLHFIIAITLFSSSGITFLISIISPPFACSRDFLLSVWKVSIASSNSSFKVMPFIAFARSLPPFSSLLAAAPLLS